MIRSNIAIIIPYFGKWPDWIELYFHSCAKNSFVDWHFITDCEIPEHKSENLHFQKWSFPDYCKFVSEKLKIDFMPISAYKLCGLKPFYGFIHKDLLERYEFWGFGDIDVVWGDLAKFYPDKLLKNHDVLSTHADRLSGHLAILRNTQKYTEACFQINNWQTKLESEDAIPLDEQDFSWLLYPQSKYISKFYSKVIRRMFNWRDAWVIYYNIMPVVNKLLNLKNKKLYFKEQHTTPILGNDGKCFKHDTDEWQYRNGKIINCKTETEYIYLHFMIYKKNLFREDHFWKNKYYSIPRSYDFDMGVKIDKKGFSTL